MSKMKMGVHDIPDQEAVKVFTEFTPNLPHALGVQLGALNGFQEGLIEGMESAGASTQNLHPVRYDVDIKMLGLDCPLFEGVRPAMTIGVEVLYNREYKYPPAYDVWLVETINRFAAVMEPSEDGKFTVLYVESDPDDLEQQEEVVAHSYDYEKAVNDPIGSFHSVVAEIVQFLLKNKPQ